MSDEDPAQHLYQVRVHRCRVLDYDIGGHKTNGQQRTGNVCYPMVKEARHMEEKRDRDVRDQEQRDVEARSEVEEVGRKGGAASMSAGMPYAGERASVAVVARDLVRWGPIWAGLLLALAVQLVLGGIGLAIALSSHNPAAPNYADMVAGTLSWWNAFSMLIALFVGGYIAGRMAAVLGLRNGVTQGSVVWALALLIGVILSVFGVAGVIGSSSNLPALLSRGVDVSAPAAQKLVRAAASSAWWFVGASILAWAAAAAGGLLGSAAHVSDLTDTNRPVKT